MCSVVSVPKETKQEKSDKSLMLEIQWIPVVLTSFSQQLPKGWKRGIAPKYPKSNFDTITDHMSYVWDFGACWQAQKRIECSLQTVLFACRLSHPFIHLPPCEVHHCRPTLRADFHCRTARSNWRDVSQPSGAILQWSNPLFVATISSNLNSITILSSIGGKSTSLE